ncbi:MAG: AI-2E family transporter [Candidatus Sungbacteria bacterium]|uniref:AI-2E family transporter n=1 Tax=Candidatus Sungiibacteriota bacterium TaxID=2750080 RepID=A0A932VR50_9BACT|nr:AI-2E family transporter [Candidatus Sungbacteria bacterium]
MPSKDFQYLHISTWTMVRFFLIVLSLAVLYAVRDVIFSLVFAVIVASAVEPGIEWLKERKIPRILGVILVYLSGAAIFFFLVYLIFPLLAEEIGNFSATYPLLETQIHTGVQWAGSFPLLSFLGANIEGLFRIPAQYIEGLSGGASDVASTAFGGIFSFVLIVVFSFYLAAQERGIESFLRLVTPLRYEPYALDLWGRSQRKLGRWLRSQMLLGAVVGVLIFFGLTMLGMDHALFFATLSGMFEIIPVVGPILAAVPAVTAAFLTSPSLGILTVALYILVQQVESHVIVPVVMRKTVGLSPLVVVLALLIGGKIGGIFGVLLAVPMTVIAAELLNDWDKKKRTLIPE